MQRDRKAAERCAGDVVSEAPAPTPTPVVVLQPGVPVTLQMTVGTVTVRATVTVNVSPNGAVNFTVDSSTVTVDSDTPI